MVPSPFSSKGLASPLGDRAGVLLKHMNMKMSLKVSTPPLTATSALPVCSSRIARWTAERLEAQAASTTQFVPCRSSLLAIRPATTLPSRPGKLFSCQPT